MKLILIRHGETYWNHEKRVQGAASDIGLNDTGLEQARKLGAFLRHENIVAIVSSPMRRATATAEAIASHHRLPVEVDQGLTEISVGELEGMSVADLSTTFSRFLVQWWRDGGAGRSPNGETIAELQHRAWNAIEGVLERHRLAESDPGNSEEPAVVVVSHYFVTLAIILKVLELPVDCFTKFKVDPGGLSILEIGDHGPRLLTFNDTSYQC